MNANSDEDIISGSLIGTKEYWDQCYEQELHNYHDFGDVGEVWFGLRHSSQIIEWIDANMDPLNDAILDIGCGNGFILISLAKRGFSHLFGVDYSSNSIELSQEIAKKELKTPNFGISFEVIDIMSDKFETNSCLYNRRFNCILDKGTYDAICLMPDVDINSVRHKYKNAILKLISSNGIFILMSCNFTKEQLFEHLMIENSFVLLHEMQSPVISFGGKTGNQVTGLVLKKISNQ